MTARIKRPRADETGDVMISQQATAANRIIDPMIALASCSMQHRIVVAGVRSIELMLELHRRGYLRAAATANCGRPACQYDAVLVDWRWRTLSSLEMSLDRLASFVSHDGVLVVWVDAQKPVANQTLRAMLEQRGFVIEQGAIHDCGCALSARRRENFPFLKAA
jgi:hypothetical protein